MRKIVFILLILIFIFINANNMKIFANKAIYPPDIAQIIKKGKLTVGLWNNDIPPFFWVNEKGNLVGLDIDIVKSLAKSLGVKLEINRTAKNYSELVQLLQQRKFDLIIGSVSITSERAKKILFSKPYVSLDQLFLINRITLSKYKCENDPLYLIKNYPIKIGILNNSAYQEFARQITKKAILIGYNNIENALTDLSNNKLTALFYDDNELYQIIYKNPKLAINFKQFIVENNKDYVGIGVNWQDIYLIQYINTYFEIFSYDFNTQDLIKKYPKVYQ